MSPAARYTAREVPTTTMISAWRVHCGTLHLGTASQTIPHADGGCVPSGFVTQGYGSITDIHDQIRVAGTSCFVNSPCR